MINYIRKAALLCGWILIAVIVFSTLSPIALRPKTGRPDLERFGAFFLAGLALAVAYPRRGKLAAVLFVLGACVLETAQLFVPGRDAHIHDALIKALGGILGVMVATLFERIALL
jgi:glycopeptide antibiotics resistance protein